MIASSKRLRGAVVDRAECRCESCGKWCGFDGHWDHFWGRAKVPESLENSWYLCISCDHHKTVNDPCNAWWVDTFRTHCLNHGYFDEAHRCEVRLDVLQQKGLSP